MNEFSSSARNHVIGIVFFFNQISKSSENLHILELLIKLVHS